MSHVCPPAPFSAGQTDGPKYVGVQAETEYAGRNWSSGLKLINIDLIRGSGFLCVVLKRPAP